MRATVLIVFTLLFFCYSCGCKSDCFTPPPVFVVEIQDSETGENLLKNGIIKVADIQLIATDSGQPVTFEIVEDQIASDEIGWKSAEGSTELELKLGDAGTVRLTIVFEARSENCCTFYELKGASFSQEYEMIDEYSYVIKL